MTFDLSDASVPYVLKARCTLGSVNPHCKARGPSWNVSWSPTVINPCARIFYITARPCPTLECVQRSLLGQHGGKVARATPRCCSVVVGTANCTPLRRE